MLSTATLSLLLGALAPVRSLHLDPRDFDAPFLPCYDYIIVGGGVSGLVVANRLTEDPDVTVLVLEAGDLDQYEDMILYPIQVGNGMGTKYDWNNWTVPQTHLDGAARPYDMGRGVGGGSLINGMCWTRGGRADYDAWVALGNDGWGWDNLLPYFKKSENYTDNVDADFSRELYIQPDPSTHGTEGYVHVSYPRYFYNQSHLFLDGLQELGIPILTDPNNGTAAGGMLIPDSISPENQTRSTTRLAYYDGFVDRRPNLHIASRQHATRLLLRQQTHIQARDYSSGLWISGVEFVTNGNLVLRNVSCSREVILAAGAAHTPQILELSGMGSADVLNQFNIPIVLDLPGVGNNFQDHPYVGVIYYYDNSSYFNINMLQNNPTLLDQVARQYYANKTGPWTAGAINTVAFPSLPSTSKNWTIMMADASAQNASLHLLPALDQTLVAGYAAQKNILVALISRDDVGAYEILNDNVGLMGIAAMHTFSRGSIHIQSLNAFDQPLIDPRYCSNPLDCQIIVEGLLFNNRIVNTTSMKLLDPAPYSPFSQDATPESLMPAVRSGVRTEFHGSGTTAMLPLALGGVVDTRLRVYGTKNLRIVDAGIFPLIPAAHLQAPVYAVAEKAADIIKADNAGIYARGCGTNSSFAEPGPVVSNSSSAQPILMVTNTSSTQPLTVPTSQSSSLLSSISTTLIISSLLATASTFPDLLNSSMLAWLTAAENATSSSLTPAVFTPSPGVFEEQPTTTVQPGAVSNAATLFLGSPTSSPLNGSSLGNSSSIATATATASSSLSSSASTRRPTSTGVHKALVSVGPLNVRDQTVPETSVTVVVGQNDERNDEEEEK